MMIYCSFSDSCSLRVTAENSTACVEANDAEMSTAEDFHCRLNSGSGVVVSLSALK